MTEINALMRIHACPFDSRELTMGLHGYQAYGASAAALFSFELDAIDWQHGLIYIPAWVARRWRDAAKQPPCCLSVDCALGWADASIRTLLLQEPADCEQQTGRWMLQSTHGSLPEELRQLPIHTTGQQRASSICVYPRFQHGTNVQLFLLAPAPVQQGAERAAGAVGGPSGAAVRAALEPPAAAAGTMAAQQPDARAGNRAGSRPQPPAAAQGQAAAMQTPEQQGRRGSQSGGGGTADAADGNARQQRKRSATEAAEAPNTPGSATKRRPPAATETQAAPAPATQSSSPPPLAALELSLWGPQFSPCSMASQPAALQKLPQTLLQPRPPMLLTPTRWL